MGRVASFGSINRDRVIEVDGGTLADLRGRYDWFPGPGETRAVESVPPAMAEHVTEVLVGGKGANQAVAAAAAGAATRLYGAVGEEDDVRAVLADRGVDVSGVTTADDRTGAAYVFVGPDGESHVAIVAGANGTVDPAYAREQAGAVADADVLLIQNEVPAAATVALLDDLAGRPARPVVVLDPAPADGAAALVDHDCVDVVTPNESEAAAVEDTLAQFQGTVVRTRGPDPVVVTTGSDRFEVTPPPADPADATGAGDVFVGYLAAELADGIDLLGAVRVAATAASLSVERSGVQRATPDRAAVVRRLTGD